MHWRVVEGRRFSLVGVAYTVQKEDCDASKAAFDCPDTMMFSYLNELSSEVN